MRKKKLTPFQKDVERFVAAMMAVDKTTNVIVKGHLLVEEKLWAIVKKVAHHPEKLDGSRLTFYQLTLLAEAVCPGGAITDRWPEVLKLNQLRNKLAHALEAGEIEQAMKAFTDAHFADGTVPRPEDPEKALYRAIANLWIWLDIELGRMRRPRKRRRSRIVRLRDAAGGGKTVG
ncbi:MAG TPA: hypothetical protein VHE30_27195 [Polyangiaceae bacterium]|nr:hypothetical protein [Polyangiaceae bacterium]